MKHSPKVDRAVPSAINPTKHRAGTARSTLCSGGVPAAGRFRKHNRRRERRRYIHLTPNTAPGNHSASCGKYITVSNVTAMISTNGPTDR